MPPQRSATALLILDMFSDFRFPDGPQVLRAARRIAPRIRKLCGRARAAGIAVLYVNDNLGKWRSDMPGIVERCGASGAKGRDIAAALTPHADDYLLLKPRHSAFYATPLEALLQHFRTRRLVLTGMSSHQCVLFTANDAHVRNFELVVPRDCIAAPTPAHTRFAVKYFESVLSADVRPSGLLRMATLVRTRARG
jgi:nicotinamidase-related amidase